MMQKIKYIMLQCHRTSLNDLFFAIRTALENSDLKINLNPLYRDFRQGDVRHSQADISKSVNYLSYKPEYDVFQGIEQAMPWYIRFLQHY